MRIWHEDLISKLCQKHLCAMWREGLGMYKIITGEVDGGSYKKHPAVREFKFASDVLYFRLNDVRQEMIKRGYHPKEMPQFKIGPFSKQIGDMIITAPITPWQTLEEQIEVIRSKHCKCQI